MAEVTESKEICPKCGVGVREHTSFCYSCGADIKSRIVVAEPQEAEEPAEKVESEKALEDLAEKLKDKPKDDKDAIAKAAKERRKARVNQRKLREYVWEPQESPPILLLFIIAAVSLGLAALAIYAVLFLT